MHSRLRAPTRAAAPGIQADLKAFAAAGCFGTSAIVALTAQNTVGVTAVHELPPAFVRAQLEAVFDDIGVDAAKTGMLFSAPVIETVADFLARASGAARGRPGDGRELRGAAARRRTPSRRSSSRLFPLATVVTPNLVEARGARRRRARSASSRSGWSSSARRRRSSPAVTASRSTTSSTASGTSRSRSSGTTSGATHGAGCTHSATLAALLARGLSLEEAARGAAEAASRAVAQGLPEIGAGDGPVDVLGLRGAA